MFKYILLGALSLCLASCGCHTDEPTKAEVEKLSVELTVGDVPIYCCTTIEHKKDDYYFVTNLYVINLPQGYTLEHHGEPTGKGKTYIAVHQDGNARFSTSVATKSYPIKGYRDFVITNKETSVPVKLPYWE